MTQAAPALTPDMLTVEQIMQLTQLGRNTVYDLVNSGQIAAIRVGKNIRVPREEYEAWKARTLGTAARGRPAPITFTVSPKGKKAATTQGRR